MVLAFLQGELFLNILNSYKVVFFFLADCFIFVKRLTFTHVFLRTYNLTFGNGHTLYILKLPLLLKSNSNNIKNSHFCIHYNAYASIKILFN